MLLHVQLVAGREALAGAFGVQPVPDRARFVSEFARLLHGLPDRKPLPPEILRQQLRQIESTAANELVPVPLTAAVWSKAVFLRTIAPRDLVVEILGDRKASLLCYGLSALDDATLEYLAGQPGVLTQLYVLASEQFAVFASTVRIAGNRVVTPGGSQGVPLWEAIVGESVTRPDRFLIALFTQAEGRIASLYDTVGQLDEARQRFALGLWLTDPAARLERMHALALAAIAASGDWRTMKTQPFLRVPYDLAASLMRVRVDASGRPEAPSSRGFWTQAAEGFELPADPGRLLKEGADQPIDAAWLIGWVAAAGAADIRVRAERLDQLSFGQRVFAEASAAEAADVFVAVRAFRRYRMLMVTLERIGIGNPATYVAAARLASRTSSADSTRAFLATAQFQGALALVARMRLAGTIDARSAETLVDSLLAVPLGANVQYSGGIARWIGGPLAAVLPRGPSVDAVVEAALAGPADEEGSPRIDWEGKRYRVDVAAGELQRIQRIREKQESTRLDLAVALDSAARRLTAASLTLEVVKAVNAQLKALMQESGLNREAFLDVDALPPGVAPPPNPRDRLTRSIDELDRIANAAGLSRAARAAADLVDAADEAAAEALVSLVYAVDLGDPEGAALLVGDVSHRHDFGFGQRDTDQRLRAAWMMPRPDVSPGIPWHVDGSLLGLDVALAPTAMRRIGSDRALAAPTLTSNDRETFGISFGLMNAFALSDAARDAIAAAVEDGRRRINAVKDAADADRIADELHMDGWRRRAVRWTVVNEPAHLESMFSLRELVALGDAAGKIDLDPWGTSATVSEGCVCTRMPPPGRLPLYTGRRQIGLLGTTVPDLNIHVARMLSRLRLPARLAKYVLSAAVQDFIDEVPATDPDDWLSLVRAAGAVPRDRIEDYVAAAAADGPLLPDSPR
jgi:hypothetical protein